jgi:hypothetical protein
MNFIKKVSGSDTSKSSGCCGVEFKETETTKEESCCGTSNNDTPCCN